MYLSSYIEIKMEINVQLGSKQVHHGNLALWRYGETCWIEVAWSWEGDDFLQRLERESSRKNRSHEEINLI